MLIAQRLRTGAIVVVLSVLSVIVSACAGGVPDDATQFLPADDAIPGWTRHGETRLFSSDNLYELVDGQADAFFAYGFTQAALGRYLGPQGAGLRIEVFRLASPADAYGLFSVSISGDPIAIGAEGDTDPGRRLTFWQERYYVRIQATQPIADEVLRGFGRAVAGALPSGGELPDLVTRLPTAGLQPRSARFFHQEISVQSWLWLGGTNPLGLNHETQGVLADYELGGKKARLLLVAYPRAANAVQALQVLQGEGGSALNLVLARVKDKELVAVFGDIGLEDGERLVSEVLR